MSNVAPRALRLATRPNAAHASIWPVHTRHPADRWPHNCIRSDAWSGHAPHRWRNNSGNMKARYRRAGALAAGDNVEAKVDIKAALQVLMLVYASLW